MRQESGKSWKWGITSHGIEPRETVSVMEKTKRALFLVDGEHHPLVVRDAVLELESRLDVEAVALYFLGGTEKVEDLSQLEIPGIELVVPLDPLAELQAVLARVRAVTVVDLSDLPVLGPARRMGLAARALAAGVSYRGADFQFFPPRREQVLDKPSCSIIGTGKRCGKTAVSAEMARYLLESGLHPVVVAMGRGGPAEPFLLEDVEVTGDFLLAEMERGMHAASDNYEDALMAEVTTIGCRRCGGGMAGEAFITNCIKGAQIANGLAYDRVIMEGSGSSIPPVATDSSLCVISASQDLEESIGFLGAYKILISQGVLITMAEEPFASPQKLQRLRERIEWINPDAVVLKTVFRPHPLKSIQGRKVFLFSTAPEGAGPMLEGYLREREECIVVGKSHSLANRRVLREELEQTGDAEILLTELKAAAVDTVADFARKKGQEIVYFHNIPIPANGESRLDSFFERIWRFSMENNLRT
jgi:cyclic 2,3-diphosphoglycerate synthase